MRRALAFSPVSVLLALLGGCPLPAAVPSDVGADTRPDQVDATDGRDPPPDRGADTRPDQVDAADGRDLPPDGTGPAVTTLYVDGRRGTDGATGTAEDPFRSITEAVEAAAGLEGFIAIAIRGAADGSPSIEYSAQATGETFPIVPRPGVSLAVPAGQNAHLSGGGPCDEDVPCALLIEDPVGNPRTEVRNLTVISTGYGVAVRQRATVLLEDIAFRGDLTSLLLRDQATVEGRRVTSEDSATEAFWVREAGRLTLVDCLASGAGSGGLVVEGDGAVIHTSSCTFMDCGPGPDDNRGGAFIRGNVVWTSENDRFLDNRVDGVALLNDLGQPSVTMSGAEVRDNAEDGLFLLCGTGAPCMTLRGSTVIGNRGAGIRVSGSGRVDLGTPASPGGNLFSDDMTPNESGALCVAGSSPDITAFGNTWTTCPPETGAVCQVGVDIGGSTQVIDTGGCTSVN